MSQQQMLRPFAWVPFLAWMVLGPLALTSAQQQAADGTEMTTQIYQVADLVGTSGMEFGFDGFRFVEDPKGNIPMRSGPGGGMGGMGGGGIFSVPGSNQMGGMGGQGGGGGMGEGQGGGLGGGLWLSSPAVINEEDLERLITETCDPQHFDESDAWLRFFEGRLMIVRHSAAGHREIELLLQQLRESAGALRNVELNAWWIFAPRATVENALQQSGRAPEGLQVLGEELRFHQMVMAQPGLRVHLVAGNLTDRISSYIPVVGQVERPLAPQQAQRLDDLPLVMAVSRGGARTTQEPALPGNQPRGVGYQPVRNAMLFGSLLEAEVTPVGEKYSIQFANYVNLDRGSDQKRPFVDDLSTEGKDLMIQQFTSRFLLEETGKCQIVGGGAMQAGRPELGECWLVLMIR